MVYLPCKPGVAGSILGFNSLLDETKPWPRLHKTLAVGAMINPNTQHDFAGFDMFQSTSCESIVGSQPNFV